MCFWLGNNEEDQLAAEEEEREAISLQQRMTSHLSQEDFDHFDIEVSIVRRSPENVCRFKEITSYLQCVCCFLIPFI